MLSIYSIAFVHDLYRQSIEADQTLPAEKLNLNKKEIKQIIAFMKALTDTAYQQQLQIKK